MTSNTKNCQQRIIQLSTSMHNEQTNTYFKKVGSVDISISQQRKHSGVMTSPTVKDMCNPGIDFNNQQASKIISSDSPHPYHSIRQSVSIKSSQIILYYPPPHNWYIFLNNSQVSDTRSTVHVDIHEHLFWSKQWNSLSSICMLLKVKKNFLVSSFQNLKYLFFFLTEI